MMTTVICMTTTTKVYAAKTDALTDPDCFQKGYDAVGRERQQKIDRLMRIDDKRRSLAAALLLKEVLHDCGIEQPSFCYGENGKPYIDGRDDVFFSLSHSGDTVMCAVSSKEVGCDVQTITDIDLRVAERFSRAEREAITAEPTPDKQRDLFFRLWTLKESFLKATGLGLSLPLPRFTIAIHDDISVTQDISTDTFYFKEYSVFDNCRFAVCAMTPTIGELIWISLVP